ncbi:MAG TPA: hypothetical protein VFI91_00730 [Longimicrobiaceae bacterium]|nr:hypothetical protein [Longimicrobiaceae bacterium]
MQTAQHAIFVVGRISHGERRMVFVDVPARAPFPGPWEVRAVFSRGGEKSGGVGRVS